MTITQSGAGGGILRATKRKSQITKTETIHDVPEEFRTFAEGSIRLHMAKKRWRLLRSDLYLKESNRWARIQDHILCVAYAEWAHTHPDVFSATEREAKKAVGRTVRSLVSTESSEREQISAMIALVPLHDLDISKIDAEIVKKENSMAVLALIDRLPRQQKHLAWRVYEQGATREDIAKELKIPMATVDTRLYRLRGLLREIFKDVCD